MNEAAAAMERDIKREHQKATVVRALAAWETWIVMGSLAYFAWHFLPWARAGFPVVGL